MLCIIYTLPHLDWLLFCIVKVGHFACVIREGNWNGIFSLSWSHSLPFAMSPLTVLQCLMTSLLSRTDSHCLMRIPREWRLMWYFRAISKVVFMQRLVSVMKMFVGTGSNDLAKIQAAARVNSTDFVVDAIHSAPRSSGGSGISSGILRFCSCMQQMFRSNNESTPL